MIIAVDFLSHNKVLNLEFGHLVKCLLEDNMIHTSYYESPLGKIILASKEGNLIGLWLPNQKYYLGNIKEDFIEEDDDILIKTKKWLDLYFNGKKPSINELPLKPMGSSFAKEVWSILCQIPYGKVITYGDIAKEINKTGKKTSARAVGSAVGHNPISIIIPCHRVVGKGGNLTGYAGGIDKKIYLLKHENTDMSNLYVPKKTNRN